MALRTRVYTDLADTVPKPWGQFTTRQVAAIAAWAIIAIPSLVAYWYTRDEFFTGLPLQIPAAICGFLGFARPYGEAPEKWVLKIWTHIRTPRRILLKDHRQ